MRISLIVAITSILVGCGIPGDTPLNELDANDWSLICDRAVDTTAEDRVVDCSGTEITIPASTIADCTNFGASATAESCTATLDTWVSCKEEPDLTDGQICGTEEYTPSAECIAVVGCIVTAE